MTLLEVLVALALMSLIAVASTQVLRGVLMTRNVQHERAQMLAQWQRALNVIQRDIAQAQSRSVRSDTGGLRPALVLEEGTQLELTTGGRRNPLEQAQSPLLRVRYRVGLHPHRHDRESAYHGDEQRYLLREAWFHIDEPRADPADWVQALLPEPEGFLVEIIRAGERHSQWPLARRNGSTSASASTPVAEGLVITLEHPRSGVVERWFSLDRRAAELRP